MNENDIDLILLRDRAQKNHRAEVREPRTRFGDWVLDDDGWEDE